MTVQAGLPPLVFDGPLAIVGGGRVDEALLRELAARGVALVGADGGADSIAAAGLQPEAIVGDLDSLRNRAGWAAETRVIHLDEQLTTDFEKALYSSHAPVTIALGMTGGRLDHTLAALSALQEYGAARRLMLVDETDVAMVATGPVAFTAGAGERVSVYPMLPVAFTRSEGLEYPLDGLQLRPGGRLGTSNTASGGEVVIVPADAAPWLLILQRERLWDLLEM